MLTETDVTGASAFRRLFTEQASALEVPLPDLDEPRLARGGPQPSPGPRPRAPRRGRTGRDRGAAPRAPHARVRVQHAAGRQGHQGPPAQLPALARVAQPRQRGERRVGRGPDRRRGGPLRPRPPLVRAEGEAARARAARLLRPDGPGVGLGRAHPLRRGAAHRARLLLGLLARAGPDRLGVLRERLHRRPAAARQARRGLLLLHRPVGPPLRDAQLHLPPVRRPHDGARAGPRRARLPGPAAGHLPLRHAADPGRDGIDLRRDDRARGAARARARGRPAGSTCSPVRSTAPSRRSSGRSR